MSQLALVIGWVLTILLGVFGAVVLWKIIDGTIKINRLISDEQGYASLSRFQFLTFTFVIAMSLFYVIASQTPTPKYPEIPNQILALLGISGGSFVLSKGIQSSRDVSMAEAVKPPTEAPTPGSDESKT